MGGNIAHMSLKEPPKPSKMPPPSASSSQQSHQKTKSTSLCAHTRNHANSVPKRFSSQVARTGSRFTFLMGLSSGRETSSSVLLQLLARIRIGGRIVRRRSSCGDGMRRRSRWRLGMVCCVLVLSALAASRLWICVYADFG